MVGFFFKRKIFYALELYKLINYFRYVKCDEMAASATEAVKTGELKIIPEQFKKTWYYWMQGIRDWCISRQLWWGHRIPAYYVSIKSSSIQVIDKDNIGIFNFFNKL